MKSKLINIVFVLIIALNGYFVFTKFNEGKRTKEIIDEREKYYTNKIQVVDELRKLEIANEFSPVSISAKVQLPNNDKISLKSIIGKDNKLFFCIPEGVCNICYDSLYATFNRMADEMGAANIVILVPSNRLREMTLLFEGKSLNNRIFGISSEELDLTIQGAYLPYLFVMDSSMISRNLHLPHKNEQSLTGYYLTTVKKRYFTASNL